MDPLITYNASNSFRYPQESEKGSGAICWSRSLAPFLFFARQAKTKRAAVDAVANKKSAPFCNRVASVSWLRKERLEI